MSLSLIKRSSSPHPPPLLLPVPPPPPPGSWLQLWKPMGESLLVLGLGDDRLWPWWVGATCFRSCTDMDLPNPRSISLDPEQQPSAGGTRGSSSKLICLLQDPSSFVLSLLLLFPWSCCPNLLSPNPRPRSFLTTLSSICVPRPPQKSSMSGDTSMEAVRTKVPGPWLRLGGGGGGSLARRGNPPSLTPLSPELLTLFGVRMGGELPIASSVPLSGVVAWAWGWWWWRWWWWCGRGDGLKEDDARPEGGVEEGALRLRLSSLGGPRMRWSPPCERWELVEERVTKPLVGGAPLLLTWVEQDMSLLKTEEW